MTNAIETLRNDMTDLIKRLHNEILLWKEAIDSDTLPHVINEAVAVIERVTWSTDMDAAKRLRKPILVKATRIGWESSKPEMVCAKWYEYANKWYIYGCGTTKTSPQWLDECTPKMWMPLPHEGDQS